MNGEHSKQVELPTTDQRLDYPVEMRMEVASRIAAGFAANPAIFAPHPSGGWELVNCTYRQLAEMARDIADHVIAVSHESVK